MSEGDERLERAIGLLKEPVRLDPSFDRRVMADIDSAPPPRAWVRPIWVGIHWMRRGRAITVSPLAGLATAAGLVMLLLIGRAWLSPGEQSLVTAAADFAGGSVVLFVIVHPTASSVSLVGDFNDWSDAAMPMKREAGNGLGIRAFIMPYWVTPTAKKVASQARMKPRQTFCVRMKRSTKTGDSHQASGMVQKKPTSVPMASQR